MNSFDQFASVIAASREALLRQWRAQVRELPGARELDAPTLTDHIPQWLDELVAAFRAQSNRTIPGVLGEGTAPAHGAQRLADGFDIAEVVAEYSIMRGCLQDLAEANGIDLQGRPLRILNRTVDGAIGAAVETYARSQAEIVKRRRAEYLAFVMHDLRTPLGAISLSTDLLGEISGGPSSDPRLHRALTTLRRNVDHLCALVNKVIDENVNLESEAGYDLTLRRFELWSLVGIVVSDLRGVADDTGVRIVEEVPYDLVVRADANLLRRVVQNLIANAIEYAPQGAVTIGARLLGSDGTVECWVSDDGAGIPAERLDHVFDKYETDPNTGTGLGLGLAIVKTLVEAHGGEVRVESTIGVGTRFTLRIPG